MGRYFGTDGIRGRANIELNAKRAFDVGRYLGYYFSKSGRGKILIGKDTRLSSSMFENAIAAGITSSGSDVYLIGYCPTPTIAYLSKNKDFDCGVMISASHNPFYDNGIKIFSHEGVKLSSDIENLIEDYIDTQEGVEYKTDKDIGRVIDYHSGLDLYLDWLKIQYPLDLTGFNIAIDCANGSASTTAKQLLESLNANCTVIHNDPNGININTKCGSTHPEELQNLMRSDEYDIGFAFDGDADRLIGVDSNGDLLTGDHILYICGKYLKENNQLVKNTVVTTVMANLGLLKSFENEGISYVSTQVGDKYVYEEMLKSGFIFGGEQSGHIIFSDHLTTGDGLLTALNLLLVMKSKNQNILELSKGIKIYPQLLTNIKVENKEEAMNDEEINKEINKVREELGDNGRILVRPSGTEPLVRVMVEAESDETCEKMVKRITDMLIEKYA
ncbi:MAG: phosphoglucosamine mutase [Erysipelotrichaceae bacterium]|nr:phosphoglucosamine mutase [Erysipelotrichaceae bacterium]